jgi:hypothetical protein
MMVYYINQIKVNVLIYVCFGVLLNTTFLSIVKTEQPLLKHSNNEEKLLLEMQKEFPELVTKYSQLSLEYNNNAHSPVNREKTQIFLRADGYARWDIEGKEGTVVYLALPKRAYKFMKKNGSNLWTLALKGNEKDSIRIRQLILSSDVVRSPFAESSVPLWLSFEFLDNPSFDHSVDILFREAWNGVEKPELKHQFYESEENNQNLVTITTEITNKGKKFQIPTVFLKDQCYALKSTKAIFEDESGNTGTVEYHREYDGTINNIPLLKKASTLTYSDSGQLLSNEEFLVTHLELSPPPLEIFDPKQFLPPDTKIGKEIQPAYFSWGRILFILFGVFWVLVGLWMKIKQKNLNVS